VLDLDDSGSPRHAHADA
jgi:hypothetical protein